LRPGDLIIRSTVRPPARCRLLFAGDRAVVDTCSPAGSGHDRPKQAATCTASPEAVGDKIRYVDYFDSVLHLLLAGACPGVAGCWGEVEVVDGQVDVGDEPGGLRLPSAAWVAPAMISRNCWSPGSAADSCRQERRPNPEATSRLLWTMADPETFRKRGARPRDGMAYPRPSLS
jgi:hypothetical protein